MLCESNVISGNTALWERAYTENFATLCFRAQRKLTNGNSFQAEDAVSEAFVRIMRYVTNPETIQSPVSYWWTTIKRVWAVQQAKPNAANTVYLEDMDADVLESLPAVQVEPEILSALAKADAQRELRFRLGPLSLEERQLVAGRLEGYSFAEIANQLGEDVKLTRFRWHKLKARERYRLNKGKAQTQTAGDVA